LAQHSFQPQQVALGGDVPNAAPQLCGQFRYQVPSRRIQSTSVSAGDSRFLCSVDGAFELGWTRKLARRTQSAAWFWQYPAHDDFVQALHLLPDAATSRYSKVPGMKLQDSPSRQAKWAICLQLPSKLVVLLYRIQDRVAAEMWRESRGLF
jgi:hypothetical protein